MAGAPLLGRHITRDAQYFDGERNLNPEAPGGDPGLYPETHGGKPR